MDNQLLHCRGSQTGSD